MPLLDERVDATALRVSFPLLPKSRHSGNAIAFFDGEPIADFASAASLPPMRWVKGKPTPIAFPNARKLAVRGASKSQIVGSWTTPTDDDHAVVWSRARNSSLIATDLHPPHWDRSVAIACDGDQQVGFGYEAYVSHPSRALLWRGNAESVVMLTGSDETVDAVANGVSDGLQVGRTGSCGEYRACLWRGSSETFVQLHPAGAVEKSEALGAGGGEQVGHTWSNGSSDRAALWSGSAESYTDLAPDGFIRSRALACARGFQAGWVSREPRGMRLRAVLWGGSAEDYIDLQAALPAPWNASWATAIDVDGNRVRILGTARQVVTTSGNEMNAGEQPVIWELELRVGQMEARGLAPGGVGVRFAQPSPSF